MRKPASLSILATALAVAGCSRGAPESPGSEITGPVLVEMNPSGIAPLSGLIRFTTDQPMRATLSISDGQHQDRVTPIDAFNTEHELMLLGLRPNRTHSVIVSLEDQSGAAANAASFDVTTEPLPYWIPPIETRISEPDRMEPGVTLMGVFNDNDPTQNFTIALDAAGEIVWLLDLSTDEPRRLRNGNLLSITSGVLKNHLKEFDMLGRFVREWQAIGTQPNVPEGVIPVATDTFHHDVLEMPSGNFLAISSEIRHLETYQTHDTQGAVLEPKARDIVGDRIIEFRPDDGAIVREWQLTDLLDPRRMSHGPLEFVLNFYDRAYENVVDDPLPDWTHANGFDYDDATDTLILSIRRMSAVVKIDLAANELIWILGNHEGWGPEFADLLLEPVGDVGWTFGQHAPEITADGTLLLYDNGSFGRAYPGRPRQPVSELYSRAIEFEIDEANMTVEEVWSYGGPGSEHFFAEFVSEADRLPLTGNTLVHSGGQMVTADGQQTNDFDAGRVWVTTREVAPSGDKVWEVVIEHPMTEWGSYRAERITSLYPDI
jgi:arylsulfate sulfotransferase